jgi:hypothetical protein
MPVLALNTIMPISMLYTAFKWRKVMRKRRRRRRGGSGGEVSSTKVLLSPNRKKEQREEAGVSKISGAKTQRHRVSALNF